MAGGGGSRLWPLSTEERPKQFCALTGQQTLLQVAYERARDLVSPGRIFVGTGPAHSPLVQAQLPGLSPDHLVIEPERRDTAPAIGLAAVKIWQHMDGDPDAVLVVLAADHLMDDPQGFRSAVLQALPAALAGEHLVSVGATPTWPNTNYGYMRCDAPAAFGPGTFKGGAYVEKPDLDTAQALVDDGAYLWNTNIFVWKISTLLAAFRRYQPADHQVLMGISLDLPRLSQAQLRERYRQLERISVDHAIMERVAPADPISHIFVEGHFGWRDVGSMQTLEQEFSPDSSGNRIRGEVTCDHSRGCTLLIEPPYQLKAEGLHNVLVAVGRQGDILVMDRGNQVGLKELLAFPLVNNLRQRGGTLSETVHDGHGNEVLAFCRLARVRDCRFVADRDRTVCAAGISGLEVTARGHKLTVRQLEPHVVQQGPPRVGKRADQRLEVCIEQDYQAMSTLAAARLVEDLAQIIARQGKATITVSAGRTVEQLYQVLRGRYASAVQWRKVCLYQMDEYLELPASNPRSMAAFIIREVAEPLGLGELRLIPNSGADLAWRLRRHEERLAHEGGLDLAVHGIGENAHIGFNEPGSAFNSPGRIMRLAQQTRAANAASFAPLGMAPEQGVTLGMETLLSARKNYLLASGARKASAIHSALLGPVTPQAPASGLQRHAATTFIIDRAACDWIGKQPRGSSPAPHRASTESQHKAKENAQCK